MECAGANWLGPFELWWLTTTRRWSRPEATEFAKSTVGQRVALVPDPTQDRTDRYGGALAYLVRADGWDYSVEAARAGTSKSYVYGGRPVSRYGCGYRRRASAE